MLRTTLVLCHFPASVRFMIASNNHVLDDICVGHHCQLSPPAARLCGNSRQAEPLTPRHMPCYRYRVQKGASIARSHNRPCQKAGR